MRDKHKTVVPNKWETYAQDDPYWYIHTPCHADADLNDFWASGKKDGEKMLSHVKRFLRSSKTVTEIGCGVGRCLIPMTSVFEECIGVDISETMLGLLHKHSEMRGVAERVKCYLPTQDWHGHESDLIYSIKTLPCIEDYSVIEEYVGKIYRSLSAEGVAYLHFDSRDPSFLYRTRNHLPDFLLPRHWRRGIRRIRRDPRKLVQLFERNGFHILAQEGIGTERHICLLAKRNLKKAKALNVTEAPNTHCRVGAS